LNKSSFDAVIKWGVNPSLENMAVLWNGCFVSEAEVGGVPGGACR